jgi:hypothetical protein
VSLSSVQFKSGLKFTKTLRRHAFVPILWKHMRSLKLLLTKFKIPANILEESDLKLSSFLLSLAVIHTTRRNVREENSVAYFIINVPEFSKV